jgi:taurine transport system permease protein
MARRAVRHWLWGYGWLGTLAVVLALVTWQAVSTLGIVPADLVPGPVEVFRAFTSILHDGYRGTTLWQDTYATLYRCLAGFFLAAITGIPLGLAMGHSAKIRAAFDYIVQFMRPLPPLAYLVLLILWLGTGNTSKIALLYLTAFPILTSSAMAGVRTVQMQKIQAARSLGAGEWQVFRYVVFPSALPLILTGARIALAVTFSTVVAAELMAAKDGLGWMLFSASHFLRNDIIMLGIILLGILGMLLNRLFLALDHAIVHWRGVE